MVWVLNASPEVDAESQYPTIIAICSVLSLISIAGVSSRLFIRNKSRGLAADDWMSALSMLFALVYSLLCIAQTRYGLGLPLALRPVENLIIYTEVNFAGRPIYQLGISFFKIALLISYLRLLQGTNGRTYRTIVHLTIGLVFVSHLACALCLFFACSPIYKSWRPMVDGTCLAPGPSFTAYAIVTIASDVIVALMPIPMLSKLNIRAEKKIGLIGIFALGLFTTICSVLRYLQINNIQYGDGNSTMLILWGVVEFNVGNLVSSLPFLAPIFVKKAKNYRSKYSGGFGSSNGRSGYRSGLRGVEAYKLSNRGHEKSTFASATRTIDSEENILQENTIMKSVTYTVQVDEETAQGRRRNTPENQSMDAHNVGQAS